MSLSLRFLARRMKSGSAVWSIGFNRASFALFFSRDVPGKARLLFSESGTRNSLMAKRIICAPI